uniref:Uncharacterized protein n=1 Tax=Oryza sativa subsp. japonica TaxID=39947 RepID=Q6K8T5_ORYSJ|nr:hypothetical protein [Oryza sativa Japonica Group]
MRFRKRTWGRRSRTWGCRRRAEQRRRKPSPPLGLHGERHTWALVGEEDGGRGPRSARRTRGGGNPRRHLGSTGSGAAIGFRCVRWGESIGVQTGGTARPGTGTGTADETGRAVPAHVPSRRPKHGPWMAGPCPCRHGTPAAHGPFGARRPVKAGHQPAVHSVFF